MFHQELWLVEKVSHQALCIASRENLLFTYTHPEKTLKLFGLLDYCDLSPLFGYRPIALVASSPLVRYSNFGVAQVNYSDSGYT